jgi:cation transport ATPase
VAIGRRSMRIATQSVTAGMALSICAMAFAAAGLLVPFAGALLQEAIDVAAILNALRALRD